MIFINVCRVLAQRCWGRRMLRTRNVIFENKNKPSKNRQTLIWMLKNAYFDRVGVSVFNKFSNAASQVRIVGVETRRMKRNTTQVTGIVIKRTNDKYEQVNCLRLCIDSVCLCTNVANSIRSEHCVCCAIPVRIDNHSAAIKHTHSMSAKIQATLIFMHFLFQAEMLVNLQFRSIANYELLCERRFYVCITRSMPTVCVHALVCASERESIKVCVCA